MTNKGSHPHANDQWEDQSHIASLPLWANTAHQLVTNECPQKTKCGYQSAYAMRFWASASA